MYVSKGDTKPVVLNASPQKGEQGVSSRFIAKDDRLGGKIAVSAVSFRIRVDEGKAAYVFTPEHDD
jgi:hypothetical protein